MAEELVLTRKASGLVRGLSMRDALGVGLMNRGLTSSIWVMTGLGVSVYSGGSLIWATIISVVLAGIGFPLVWGVLGGSMLRSGGEYIFWQNDAMQGLAVTAVEIFSVLGVTAIAALVFPYVKGARRILDTSPYKTRSLAGVPVVTLGAIVDVVYLGVLACFVFLAPTNIEGFETNTGILIAVTWIVGISWCFVWKQRSKSVGVGASMTYSQLPPE